jgi:hypothetical protein
VAFKKGEGGRPKGAANKTTVAAKDAIAKAAEGLGGVDRLIAWAGEDAANERAFWTVIYPKLVPHEVTGKDGESLLPKVLVLKQG